MQCSIKRGLCFFALSSVLVIGTAQAIPLEKTPDNALVYFDIFKPEKSPDSVRLSGFYIDHWKGFGVGYGHWKGTNLYGLVAQKNQQDQDWVTSKRSDMRWYGVGASYRYWNEATGTLWSVHAGINKRKDNITESWELSGPEFKVTAPFLTSKVNPSIPLCQALNTQIEFPVFFNTGLGVATPFGRIQTNIYIPLSQLFDPSSKQPEGIDAKLSHTFLFSDWKMIASIGGCWFLGKPVAAMGELQCHISNGISGKFGVGVSKHKEYVGYWMFGIDIQMGGDVRKDAFVEQIEPLCCYLPLQLPMSLDMPIPNLDPEHNVQEDLINSEADRFYHNPFFE
jgi:hypothetical protein